MKIQRGGYDQDTRLRIDWEWPELWLNSLRFGNYKNNPCFKFSKGPGFWGLKTRFIEFDADLLPF